MAVSSDPVVKILPFHCMGHRFNPWSGKFNMPSDAAKKGKKKDKWGSFWHSNLISIADYLSCWLQLKTGQHTHKKKPTWRLKIKNSRQKEGGQKLEKWPVERSFWIFKISFLVWICPQSRSNFLNCPTESYWPEKSET